MTWESINSTTYKNIVHGEEIVVGDISSVSSIAPHIKINKWEGETSISFSLKGFSNVQSADITSNNKYLTLQDGDTSIRFYDNTYDFFQDSLKIPYPFTVDDKSILEYDSENKILYIDGILWMIDDESERAIQSEIGNEAHGRVLVAGLGLGIVNEYLLENKNVTSIVVVEISQAVIDFINELKPDILNNEKTTIIHDDIYHYLNNLSVEERFNYIYCDIVSLLDVRCINEWFRFRDFIHDNITYEHTLRGWNDDKFQYMYDNYEEKVEGIEFDIILNSKPHTNKIEFEIDFDDNLEFLYQPPLDKSLLKTHIQPPAVEGSYAIYRKDISLFHESKKHKEKYSIGKVGHIFRPLVTDFNNASIYADIHIDVDNKLFIVSIDNEFLENASYPITIDPYIGYNSEGSLGITFMGYQMTCNYKNELKAGDCTGVGIDACIYNGVGNTYFNAQLYDGDGDKVTNGACTQSQYYTLDWYSCAFTTQPTFSADNYQMSVDSANIGRGIYYIKYDNGSVGDGKNQNVTYAVFPTDNLDSATNNPYRFSIRLEYETAPEPPSGPSDCNNPGRIALNQSNYGNEAYVQTTNYGNEARQCSTCS